jgi:dipeptidyl aminopeptidase/acylaminoacyl peptidase
MKRIAFAVLLFALSASAQLTIDHIMRGPGLAGWEPRDLRWSPDGQHVYFRWKLYTDPTEKDFDTYVANRDGNGLRKLSEAEEKDAPPVRANWTRDLKRAVYIDDGDLVLWDGKHRKLTNTTDAESSAHFTHDEHHVTFVRNNNVFVASLDDGSVEQVTYIVGADEKLPPQWDDKKGTPSQEFVKAEEKSLLDVVARRAKKREEDEAKKKREKPVKPFKLEAKQTVSDAHLTADGKYAIVAFTTELPKPKRTAVANYASESGYTEDIQSREKVGDPLNATKLASISTSNGEVKWLETGLKAAGELKKDEKPEEKTEKTEATKESTPKEREVNYGPVQFSDDGTKAFVALRARDNKDAWLMAFDPATAKGRVLVSMHDDAWVRRGLQNGWMPDSANVWFVSEATGYAHLYVVPFAAGGGGPTQLTSGKWEVTEVAIADDKKSFLLTTSEESPFERHLYRLPLQGGTRTKLTATAGRHDAMPSPDGAVIADLYSYSNKPTEVFIGKAQVTTSPAPEFFNTKWIDPPIVNVPASDGTQVPARIYVPADYKAGGPAVIFVHGAGYAQNVHRWWSSYFREYMFHHFLMEHGYLVLDLDYRASSGYGRDWRTAIYRHMGGRDLADEVDAAKWLVKEKGVAANRIGIYGGSYGGFMTLMAMFTAPGVFTSGAALRPVTDWAHYNNGYTSDILNTPQTDPEAYRKSSPIYFAGGLKGTLLICHGVIDTNVHFQDTVRLTQKLIELRKENWSVAMYPEEDHSFVEPTSWADEYKRIFALFERTLK